MWEFRSKHTLDKWLFRKLYSCLERCTGQNSGSNTTFSRSLVSFTRLFCILPGPLASNSWHIQHVRVAIKGEVFFFRLVRACSDPVSSMYSRNALCFAPCQMIHRGTASCSLSKHFNSLACNPAGKSLKYTVVTGLLRNLRSNAAHLSPSEAKHSHWSSALG